MIFFVSLFFLIWIFIEIFSNNGYLYKITLTFILLYWQAYGFESLLLGELVASEETKLYGGILYLIFIFSFLISAKFARKKISLKNNIFKNYQIFISTNHRISFYKAVIVICSLLALLFYLVSYDFDLFGLFNQIANNTRVERYGLNKQGKLLPYSIPFICACSSYFLLLSEKIITLKSKLSIIFLFITSPVTISYLIEGDRTSILRIGIIYIVTYFPNYKNFWFLNNYKISKFKLKNLFNKLILLISVILIFIVIGTSRGIWFKDPNYDRGAINRFIKLPGALGSSVSPLITSDYIIPIAEFRSVNFTLDYGIENLEKIRSQRNRTFMFNNLISYPMPTYIYRFIFGTNKPLSMSKRIANNVAFDIESKKTLGFGLSPVAEGYINNGVLGVIFIGLLLGFFIARIDLFINIYSGLISIPRLIIIVWAGIGPLIMRIGLGSIYNYLFLTSLFLILSLIIYKFIFQIKDLNKIS